MIESTDPCFFPLEVDNLDDIPSKINYPFHYEPHPIAIQACEKVQEFILNNELPYNFGPYGEWLDLGKMFGVLIVKNDAGELGYLMAFSGKIGDQTDFPPFVPPVFNRLSEGDYSKHESDIMEISAKIQKLESSMELQGLKERKKKIIENSENKISAQKALIKKNKKSRKEKRKNANEEIQLTLDEESKREQYILKSLKADLRTSIEKIDESVLKIEKEILVLKKERKALSQFAQKEIFSNYTFLNANSETSSLYEIFKDTVFQTPPSGAGECAAPKLFQYAFKNGYKPITFAEFWWGKSPNSEIRKHKEYYPACTSKCFPILGFMLNSSEVETNPVLESFDDQLMYSIVFEDEDIVVVNKPSGMLSVPGKTLEHSVLSVLKKQFPDATCPLLLHRLDMDTSGLLIAAKNKNAHGHLHRQFERRQIHKKYIAVVDGMIEEQEGTIVLPLTLNIHSRPEQMVCFETGKPAVTNWKKLAEENGKTRLELEPVTGRTHQLRVHCAHQKGLGTPIIGDDLYGKRDTRLLLHAGYIQFTHPTSKQKIEFSIAAEF
jgi:tRNA pseudouridine32 synthase/23S rRNA pseudouridine746 synthase